MPDDGSSEFYKGPAYALVIGISSYQYGKPPDTKLEENEFPNLKVASKDAKDFAEFLESYGFISYNVEKLLDERATLKAIKRELVELRKKCSQSEPENPIVIVFFSGHGYADEEQNYLIPYDGERNALVGTALPHEDFAKLLDKVKTDRLVVFIDACHSGAFGAADVKGAVLEYDTGAGLGEGQGRYLIASCQKGQSSYELDDNGIFTGHLLELLKCTTDDIQDEEIDVFTLFKVLKDKVKHTAKARKGKDQEPTATMTDATGIILAINERAKDRRVHLRKEEQEKRTYYFDAIYVLLKNWKSDKRMAVVQTLRWYLDEGRKIDAPDEFFETFDECAKRWAVGAEVKGSVALLFKAYDPPKAISSKESSAQERSKPVEQAPPSVVSTKQAATETQQVPASPALIAVGPQQQKRRLSPEDAKYVLEGIMKFDYRKEFTTLSELLKWPVSEPETFVVIDGIRSDASEPLRAILDTIIDRLGERWKTAEIVESQSLTNVILQKVKDV